MARRRHGRAAASRPGQGAVTCGYFLPGRPAAPLRVDAPRSRRRARRSPTTDAGLRLAAPRLSSSTRRERRRLAIPRPLAPAPGLRRRGDGLAATAGSSSPRRATATSSSTRCGSTAPSSRASRRRPATTAARSSPPTGSGSCTARAGPRDAGGARRVPGAARARGSSGPAKLEICVMDADGSNAAPGDAHRRGELRAVLPPRREADRLRLERRRSARAELRPLPRERRRQRARAGHDRATTFDGFPMFSPDGKKLVFASNRNASRPGETNVFIADWVE